MRIVPATLADVKILAALNKHPIKNEEHPNPMTVEQLSARMSDWTYARTTEALSLPASSIASRHVYCGWRNNPKKQPK